MRGVEQHAQDERNENNPAHGRKKRKFEGVQPLTKHTKTTSTFTKSIIEPLRDLGPNAKSKGIASTKTTKKSTLHLKTRARSAKEQEAEDADILAAAMTFLNFCNQVWQDLRSTNSARQKLDIQSRTPDVQNLMRKSRRSKAELERGVQAPAQLPYGWRACFEEPSVGQPPRMGVFLDQDGKLEMSEPKLDVRDGPRKKRADSGIGVGAMRSGCAVNKEYWEAYAGGKLVSRSGKVGKVVIDLTDI